MRVSVPCAACLAAGSISSKLLQAHLNYLHTASEGIKGVDGRCLANLTWALAKLDLSSDDSALTTELALMVAPFIIRTLDTSSPQVRQAAAADGTGGRGCRGVQLDGLSWARSTNMCYASFLCRALPTCSGVMPSCQSHRPLWCLRLCIRSQTSWCCSLRGQMEPARLTHR